MKSWEKIVLSPAVAAARDHALEKLRDHVNFDLSGRIETLEKYGAIYPSWATDPKPTRI